MIKGIGTDILEISRMNKNVLSESFMNRYFTEKERELIGTKPSLAADNYAIKEAVAKVFGTGIRGFELQEIEALRDSLGKPYVNLYGKAKAIGMSLGIKTIFVTLSNTKELTVAFAIGEGD